MLRWKVSVPLLSLLVANSSAFTVAPPPPEMVLLPSTTTTQHLSSSAQLPATTTTTRLPLAKDLLALSSSSNMLSSATTVTTTAPVASTKPATTTTTVPSTSGVGIRVTDVQYDGRVPKTEADEYVTIANTSKSPMDVSGYYLYVATSGTQGATFTFPKPSVVAPGQSVRVYTNEIHKETGGYSFGSGKALWNNKGGLAVLRDAKGNKVGEFKYQGTTTASS